MDNNSSLKPKIILGIFIAQVLLDWLYCVWIKSQPDMEYHAWFYVLPLLFFFYFALSFIASIGLYAQNRLGLVLAGCILLFGSTISVISYLFIYRKHSIIEMLIVPLILINVCVIWYMAYNKSWFTNK